MNKKKILIISFCAFLMPLIIKVIEMSYFRDSLLLNFFESIFVGALFYIIIKIYSNFVKKSSNPSISTSLVVLFSLLASYRFIYFYMENITRLPFLFAFCLVLLSVLGFIFLYHFFKFVLKNDYTSLILSLAIVFFCTIRIEDICNMQPYVASMMFIAIIFLLFEDKIKVISFLKSFAVALLSFCLLSGVYNYLYNTGIIFNSKQLKPVKIGEIEITKTPNRDIFIFLLDQYSGKRVLEAMGFDNSNFIKELQKRGFRVNNAMESNYSKTVVSLSSFFNADYIENIHYDAPQDAVSNSKTFKIAKKAGYKIYYINSWPYDFNIKKGVIDEVYNVSYNVNIGILDLFIGKTVLAFILDEINMNIASDTDKFNAVLEYADDIINKNERKRLVFTHLLMPHAPYLFDKDGKKNDIRNYFDENIRKDNNIEKNQYYLGYLQYGNKIALKFIDEIFNKYEEKPIIIIMGDHGRIVRSIDEKYQEDENKYYFNTMIAYYNPDYDEKYYFNSKSHINFIRNFLNENFGTNLKNVEDKHFYIYRPYTSLKRLRRIQSVY